MGVKRHSQKISLVLCFIFIFFNLILLIKLRFNLDNHSFLRYFAINSSVFAWRIFTLCYFISLILNKSKKSPNFSNSRIHYDFLPLLIAFLVAKTLIVFMSPPEASETLKVMPIISQWYDAPSLYLAIVGVLKTAVLEEAARRFIINNLGNYSMVISVIIFVMGHSINFIDMSNIELLIFIFNLVLSSVIYYLVNKKFGLIYAILIHMFYDLVNINILHGHIISAWLGYSLGLFPLLYIVLYLLKKDPAKALSA